MSNLVPVITTAANTMPSLPADMMQGMYEIFNASFNDLGGAIRRIKVRKMDFALVDGSSEVAVPSHRLDVVILAAAPYNHAVWYERNYQPGQEPETPDLVWTRYTDTTFPDALPEECRHKIKKDGMEVWPFQIRRRVVVAVIRPQADGSTAIDLDAPYVMDLSSMSLYGKGHPEAGHYKFAGLGALCRQMSSHGLAVTPAMFPTKVVIDPNVSVTGVVSFQPVMNGTMPAFFDADTIAQIYATITSQAVADLLTVRERLDYKPGGHAGAAYPQPVPQYAYQQPVAPAPVQQPVAPAPVQQPVAPAPVQQPVAPATTPEASMLAQAAAALNAPAPAPAPAPAAATAPQQPAVSSAAVQQNVQDLLTRLRG